MIGQTAHFVSSVFNGWKAKIMVNGALRVKFDFYLFINSNENCCWQVTIKIQLK